MRRCVVFRLALAVLLLSSPARSSLAAPASPLGLGPVAATKLPNGLQVLVAPAQAADLVAIDVWVGAGTRRETAATNGVAHLMEHLLFKGTPTRKPGEIDAAIEDLGGTLNAATSYDWAHFYVTVGASDAEAALDVLADAVMHANLRQSDMDAERKVIVQEMARENNSAALRLTRAFNALQFPNHPYGRPLLGTESSLMGLTRANVLDFYAKNYVPGNVTLVLAGRLTPEVGRTMAARAFGAWPARPVPADKPLLSAPTDGPRVQRLTLDVPRGFLMLGFPAPSVKDKPDAWVMDVLLTRLGQGAGNRLEQTLLRERRLVSSISANFLTQRDAGALTVQATFEPGREDQVRDGILDEIARLRDAPLSDAELAQAQRSLLASYLFTAQTNSGRADALGFYSVIDSFGYDTDYVAHVESVTAAQVQAVARKYLTPQAATLVLLLPRVDPSMAAHKE